MRSPHPIIASLVVCTLLHPLNSVQAQSAKENADFKLAINLYNDGLFDLAAEQLKQFIDNFASTSNGVEARFYLGLTQMKLKQYDEARLTFQTFALTYQDNPKAPEAWLNVGECYVALKNFREAALAFERVKVFHPKSKVAPEALIKASRCFKLAGQTEDARRVLRIALQEYANSNAALPARTLLGQMYFEEGNLVQAQNELRRVIEGDPSPDAKAQALLILGNIYQATGQTKQADASYQEIITNHKSSSALQGAYLNLGKLQSSAGRPGEAIESFKKALANKNQADSSLLYEANTGIGDSYLTSGEIANALTYYEKAVAYAPRPTETYATFWKIAAVAAKGKNFGRSNDACKRILKSGAAETIRRKAAIRLALNAEAQKDHAQAVQYFTTFLEQYPSDPTTDEVAFRIAHLTESELHDARKAAASYEHFISRYIRSRYIDDAYMGAARSYNELKEFDRAAQLYKDLLSRFPSSEFRLAAEDRIRTIDTFESREKDAGVEKLALLLGDIVSEKDRVGLPFRLGEIYFKDLKNYAAAAAQFSNAINSGMNDSRFVDALYLRARSLEYLSWKDSKYVPKAIEAYQTFLTAYPDEARSDDAVLSVFMLSASSLQAASASYATLLSSHPDFRNKDLILQRIGVLQEQADSVHEALSTYGIITREFKNSPTIPDVAYRRIPLLLKLGLPDSAMQECSIYLNAFPNGAHSGEATSKLADLLAENGTPDRAIEHYRRLRDDFWYTSFGFDVRTKLADAYAATGKDNEAIAIYSDLLAEQTDDLLAERDVDPSLLFALGKTHYLAGNVGKAREYLFQVIAHERSGELAGAAYNILGLVAKNEGNLDLATSYFRQAGSAMPNASTTREVANLLFDNGAYDDAIKQYALLSQSAKSDTDRQYYDARIIIAHYRNDDYAAAEKGASSFLAKYKDAEDDVASFELEKGLFHYRKEEYVKARKLFDRIMDKFDDSPSAPYAMYWTGKILESTKKQPDALKLYEMLMKNYPASPVVPRVYLALGNIYYDLEKWDESIRNYKLIIDNPKADPSLLPIAMSNLIETYETAGIFDAALALTRKYLELYPNNEDSFDKKIKIGVLYQRLGYNEQSALHLQALLDEAGSDLEGEIRYYIAEANYNKGDFQQAILDFLKVPYLVTKKGKMDWTANSLYMAGQSYEKLGRFDQALTMYQQILDRPGIDESFKAAAKKEIDRVKLVAKKTGTK
jgi:TolA-binding protein